MNSPNQNSHFQIQVRLQDSVILKMKIEVMGSQALDVINAKRVSFMKMSSTFTLNSVIQVKSNNDYPGV